MFKVKELPQSDRPREKLLESGPTYLTDAELLAILLRTGMKGKSVLTIATEIINEYKNLAAVSSLTIYDWKNIKGIKKDKAATLLAAFEIARRVAVQNKWHEDKQIRSPEDIAEIYIPKLRDKVQEEFYVVCLSTANKIIKHEIISTGSLDMSIVHPREIFKAAITNNSKSIFLIHNHPSGNTQPSNEDITLTRKIVEAGKILDIRVLDHLIVGNKGFTSLANERLM